MRQTSFRITHFSIQSNHVHLIVEAGGKLGWAETLPPAEAPPPVAASRTWLGSTGWLRHGPIRLDDGPRVLSTDAGR